MNSRDVVTYYIPCVAPDIFVGQVVQWVYQPSCWSSFLLAIFFLIYSQGQRGFVLLDECNIQELVAKILCIFTL